MKTLQLIIFPMLFLALFSCKEKELEQFPNDPGFLTTNYNILPTENVVIEAVVINTIILPKFRTAS